MGRAMQGGLALLIANDNGHLSTPVPLHCLHPDPVHSKHKCELS